jgi:hypothetical protein
MVQLNVEGWNELPENVKREFEEQFKSNPKIRDLTLKAEQAELARNYVLALKYRKQISDSRLLTQQKLLKVKGEEAVYLVDMGLSHEQLDKINILTIAMYMVCDILEFFAIDVNSEIRKKDPTARIELFDPVCEIGKKARENLRYLWKKTNMFDDEEFNNRSDDMRQMLISKAKKIYINYANRFKDKNNESKS